MTGTALTEAEEFLIFINLMLFQFQLIKEW